MAPLLNAGTCECGEHATGIYEYAVLDGEGCCTGRVDVQIIASYSTYLQDEGGTWKLNEYDEIEPAAAQRKCCPDA